MKRRSISSPEDKMEKAVQSVKDSSKFKPLNNLVIHWDAVLSTGSTLLDLAISGGRIHGGGIPGGILVEIYGRSGSGKTSLLNELCGSAQASGGEIAYQDPEARLDIDHAEMYGATILKENYHQPSTVTEFFSKFADWDPQGSGINVMAGDSLAALSTELELEKGDKMGMRRAKEFSQELRKYARLINQNRWILACSNQVRQGDYGDVTPGGKALEFYSSLRISVNRKSKIEKEKSIRNSKKKIKRAIGIHSICQVTKSSLDVPFREVPIYIIFDYGIDDVRGNLQWYKDVTGETTYNAVNKTYMQMDAAIKYIEDNDLEDELKEMVITLWAEVEKKFKQTRKKKKR